MLKVGFDKKGEFTLIPKVFALLYPVPSRPMLQENMPGFRSLRVCHSVSKDMVSSANIVRLAKSVHDPSTAPILDSIFPGNSGGMHHCLNVVPIILST